ncbi:MAG: proline--tRNA ligase, partial [Firmicutes bacterium]|nr:proline--tRNA ligase [Bacillota bacterium]
MKLDKLVGDRFKERPTDCVIDSHALMIRGGYMRQVANGIFSMYMPLRRITQKIEQIIREEMDAIDGQEVLFPVVLPASLWQESGRYDQINDELLRFTDRNDTPFVLGMTHEEACLQLVREYGQSYAKYPFMVYQIQTKFRDEARSRGGLIRVREFTMKDGYSFHTSQEDLEKYYDRCHKAYERIYARVGVPEVISVASDSGMMGGKIAHEFMLLTEAGEDSLVICPKCDYRANMEAAENIVKNQPVRTSYQLELVHTPSQKTIDEVAEFLGTTRDKCCKAVVYQRKADNSYIIVFMRGDLDLQETKLSRYMGCEIYPATITEDSGLCAGYLGPMDLDKNATVLFDASLKGAGSLVCGANKDEYHYTGFDISRDFGEVEYHDFAKVLEGGICPKCGEEGIVISRGVEVGNIFQLGTKYTESMNMQYTDSEGKEH